MATAASPTPGTPWADAEPRPFWLDHPDRPEPEPELLGGAEADLLVVGGGLTGLWAALQAKEEDRAREVVLLEGETIAFGASGRNGGFCSASLTHGIHNGLDRFPGEMPALERMARENFDGIRASLARHDIDAGFAEPGTLVVATSPHEVEALAEIAEVTKRFGWSAEVLDRDAVRAQIDSPTYLGAVWEIDGQALVDPARLCWGLSRAARGLGVRIRERSPVAELRTDGAGVRATTTRGTVRARRAILATSAFPPLVRAIRRYVVPVWDYVLVTEPLSEAQWASVGWAARQGVSDMPNQFHYYRVTGDGRILWGGYDAIYYYRGDTDAERAQREASFEVLSRNFFRTFPQLEGLRFSHRWGGAIDTCSRFSVMFGRALQGRAAYVVGFTGLGVGASRFGARAALDLVDGRDTERTRLEMVRRRPIPFPPEPLRSAAINLTRRELARADASGGRRGLWLRTLDRVGLGFDS